MRIVLSPLGSAPLARYDSGRAALSGVGNRRRARRGCLDLTELKRRSRRRRGRRVSQEPRWLGPRIWCEGQVPAHWQRRRRADAA